MESKLGLPSVEDLVQAYWMLKRAGWVFDYDFDFEEWKTRWPVRRFPEKRTLSLALLSEASFPQKSCPSHYNTCECGGDREKHTAYLEQTGGK